MRDGGWGLGMVRVSEDKETIEELGMNFIF